MPDPRQYVRPGQRLQIAASQINALNDMMRADTGFRAGPAAFPDPAPNVALVKNNSGQPVPWLGVLGISGTEISPDGGSLTGSGEADSRAKQFATQMVLAGGKPAGGTQPVAVAMEPIPVGGIGRMAIGGRFACKVKVLSTTHGYARGRKDDVTQLISAECGPVRLLWTEGQGNDKFGAAMV